MKIKDKILYKRTKLILKIASIILLFSSIGVLASPIIWIWVGLELAWKVSLTAIIGMLIGKIILKSTELIIKSEIEKESQEQNKNIGNFKKSLDKAIKKNM